MKTQTTQVAKAATKAAPKAASKAPSKAKGKTLAYASLLASALKGDFGAAIQRFYASAISYHKKAATVFPRARLATEALMSADDAKAFIEKHKATSIPAGSKAGQRLFDEMMVQTKAQA